MARQPHEWGSDYARLLPMYEALAIRLRTFMLDLLHDERIDVVQVDARAKSVDSFVRKVAAKGDKYADPLSDVTDLVGLRIITFYLEDVDRVAGLVEREFSVDRDNSVDRATALAPDQFGYQSVHYVVDAVPMAREMPGWSDYVGRRGEIQIRSAVQHAWASIDHKLNYKSVREVPSELQRALYRLSALFELADDQFSALRAASVALAQRHEADVRSGNLDLALDASSLDAYLSDSRVVHEVLRQMQQSGLPLDPDPESERIERDRRDLLNYVLRAGLSRVSQLDDLLVQHATDPRTINALSEALNEADGSLGSPDDFLTALIYLSTDEDDAMEDIYTEHYQGIFREARSRLHRGRPERES